MDHLKFHSSWQPVFIAQSSFGGSEPLILLTVHSAVLFLLRILSRNHEYKLLRFCILLFFVAFFAPHNGESPKAVSVHKTPSYLIYSLNL